MQIVVQGLMTHYDRQGNGPALVFLHGWADRLETFDALVPLLTNSYEVLRLDLPGFGTTQAPKAIWTLDEYAKFTKDFLTKLDIKDYSLIGHSNGGAVAIRGVGLGLLAPTKLVLLASSGVRDSEKLKKTAIKLIAKTGKAVTFWLPKPTRQKLQKKLYGTIGSDMLVAPELQETFKQTVRQDIQRDAVKITVPTLLLYGDADQATPVASIAKTLNTRISGSYLKVISGADHFVHQAATQEVAEDILEFIKT